jgi:hypothetical protein
MGETIPFLIHSHGASLEVVLYQHSTIAHEERCSSSTTILIGSIQRYVLETCHMIRLIALDDKEHKRWITNFTST